MPSSSSFCNLCGSTCTCAKHANYSFVAGSNSGLNKPSQLRMEDITMPQGNVTKILCWLAEHSTRASGFNTKISLTRHESKWLNIAPYVTDHITIAYFTAGSSRDAESSMPDVLLDNKHEIADDWRHVDTVSFSTKIIFKKTQG